MPLFTIIPVTEDQCLGWILSHPRLAEKSFSMENPKFEDTKSQYMAVVSRHDILCMVKYERFSEYSIQMHPYLNPTYWHSNYLNMCSRKIEDFFRNAGEKSLVIMCPEDAKHAIKASRKVGFRECGRVRHAVNWKGRVNDMIMLQKELQ